MRPEPSLSILRWHIYIIAWFLLEKHILQSYAIFFYSPKTKQTFCPAAASKHDSSVIQRTQGQLAVLLITLICSSRPCPQHCSQPVWAAARQAAAWSVGHSMKIYFWLASSCVIRHQTFQCETPSLGQRGAAWCAPRTQAPRDARPSPLGTEGSICSKDGRDSWVQQMLVFVEEIFFWQKGLPRDHS